MHSSKEDTHSSSILATALVLFFRLLSSNPSMFHVMKRNVLGASVVMLPGGLEGDRALLGEKFKRIPLLII